jgi:hypothetical protein
MIFGPLWPTWWGRRTPVSAGEGRTVAELLDDSDGLAREALLDMSADRAPGMVGGWPQLMQSAAQLWAVLSSDSTVSASADPIAILAAMGWAVGRSCAAGHWPGRGPRDEAWEQIASNFVQAGRLLQKQPVASEAVSTDGQVRPTTANTQLLHALHVAAHATTVALIGYERDLQQRLEVGARRRQPFIERPTALEVESARGMIARFEAIEQLAAGSLAARRVDAIDQPATGRRRPAMRLDAALAAWEVQAYRTLANLPGPGRSGPCGPRAGAHRHHHHRRRQRSGRAPRRDRRRRRREAHPGTRECPAGVEPLGTPLGRAHHAGEPHRSGPG